ncbi:MAG: TonB-dependent receptor [Thermodesulfobacteriota bacterium]|nr:TonB-dependent receptor [Thermodesulfobacteriota bacterium]
MKVVMRVLFFTGVTTILGLGMAMGAETENDQTTGMMDEIVVTATKTEEIRKDVPNAVVVIDETAIEASTANTVGELLANEAGIDFRTRGNYGGAAQSLQIRGMSDTEVQVMVNGVSVNSPSLGSADIGTIPLSNIEKIEIVKGSGSMLHGSGAMAGTVNIITKRPEHGKTDLKVSAGYGSDNTYSLTAEQGRYISDFGYYLTAQQQETDGQRDNSEMEQQDASLLLILDKNDRLDVSLYGSVVDRNFGVPGVKPPAGTVPHYINGTAFYNEDSASLVNHGSNTDYQASLDIQSRATDWLSIHLKPYFIDMENYDYARYNTTGTGYKSWVYNTVKGIDGHVALDPADSLTLLLGGDYKDFKWENEQSALNAVGGDDTTILPTTSDAKIHTKSYFSEIQYRPNAYIKLLAGAREENHSTFGRETLPHYGLVFNPLSDTAVKFTHGKHFKAPTPNDLFWPEDDFTRGNPDLKPQTGWHTDVTIEQGLCRNAVMVTASAFTWDIDDKIDWAPNPAYAGPYGPKWTPTNVNSSKGHGWEAEILFRPDDRLSAGFSYTYTSARDTLQYVERASQYLAKNRFKVNGAYKFDFGLAAALTCRYVGNRDFYRSSYDAVPTDTLDSYVTLDLKLEQRLADHWRVTLQADNLLDEEYDTYVGAFTDAVGSYLYSRYPGAGSSVFCSVGYAY